MKEMSPYSVNVNLLWTGGWDSTFQLLQLLTIHRRRVTPFYLIDADRPSTGIEIKTMKCIKDHLFKEYPYTQELLQPTHYFAVADIAPYPEITEVFKAIVKEKFMGDQYDWLPRFCKQNAIMDMQLCIHRDDQAHLVIEQFVSEHHMDAFSTHRFDQKYKMKKEYVLFCYFSFPIFNLSKLQMAAIAKEQGWNGIMAMTWFCHRPRRDLKPCGRCNPCIYTIKEGLGWRIPASSRMASAFHRAIVRPLISRAKSIVNRLQ